jgi:hypothetical protein
MNLLSNESILVKSNDDMIILTNLRIYMAYRRGGRDYQITIFLEDISSIENAYKSNIYYLVLAALSFLTGILNIGTTGSIGPTYFGLILGGIFLSLWLSTRGQQVTFYSKGGSALRFFVDHMSEQQIEDFIHKVEEARLQRLKRL